MRSILNWLVGSRRLAVILVCALVLQPAASHADVWQWLTDAITDANEVEDAARSGAQVPPGATVTGAGETRTIARGRDVLELYPSTVVTFQDGATVHLISGTVRVKAAKRKNGETLSVETPLLVATVKGTDFEVSTFDDASAVSVYEGRVAVKAVGIAGGMDVTPGKTATVSSRDNGGKLSGTPRGGAPEAARQAAKAAGSAGGAKPSKAPKNAPTPPAPHPQPAKVVPEPPVPGPAAKDPPKPDKQNKPGKPEKPDKKGKAGPPAPGP